MLLLPAEEFNDRILRPELSDSELQRLHGEVLHMYETYCLDESIDKINFDLMIVEQIRNSKQRNSVLRSSVATKELDHCQFIK